MIKKATAKIKSAKLNFLRRNETPTVSCDNNRASTNCVSSFSRERIAHQKNSASAGGITSSSQSKFLLSNCIFKS